MADMRAVVLAEWGGDLDVRTVERPEPGPGEVCVDADVGERLGLDDVPDYHRRLREGTVHGMGVLEP